MGESPLAGVMAQLAIDKGGEPVSEMLLGELPLGGVRT
jgi:hypothetical protein